jgi:hypothetical protein
MSTYATAAGRTVTTDFRTGLAYGSAHVIECNGCNGQRGFNSAEAADAEARDHAEKCTDTGTDGGAR